MLLLDRYVLREWLKVFGMTLAALVGLLLIGRMFGDVPDFMGWGASAWLMLEYFVLQIPSYLPLVLPVALLISVLFILGFFHRNQELTAMRAAGMSIFRITRVLWAAGAALAVLLFFLNATIVPWATERARFLFETAEFAHLTQAQGQGGPAKDDSRTLTYANNMAHRMWYIGRFSGYTGQGLGVSVYQSDAQDRLQRVWLANFGAYDAQRGCWVLRDGREIIYDAAQSAVAQPPFAGEKVLPELTEQPRVMLALTKKPTHLSINEIKGVLNDAGDDPSATIAAYAVQYHYVLASPFCCLIVIGLAIPFAVSGVRVNPMIGVSKSIVLFALYYLLTNLCSLLGAQQHLSPMMAAWLPNLAMFVLAVWLCRRVN